MKAFTIFLLLNLISFAIAASTSNIHRYMWVNYKQFGGQTRDVQNWYNRIFSTENHSIFTNKGYLHFLKDHGNHQRIVELIPKLQETFAHDPDIQLIFVTALKKLGNTDQADNILIRLSQEFKKNAEVVFQATETFVHRKEMDNALLLIDDYLNSAPHRPNNFIFYFLKGQILMQLGNLKQANEQVALCLDVHPNFPQGWLLLAMLEEQQGKIDNAIKGYNHYLGLVGSNKQIEHHLLALTLKQKSAQEQQPILFANKSCFAKSLILYERKQYSTALDQINQCLAQDPKDTQARLLKVQLLSTLNHSDALIAELSSWIRENPDDAIWYQTLHLLSRRTMPIERIINTLNAIHTQYPEKLLPLLYLADLYTKEGTTTKAMHFHTLAKNLVRDPQLKIRLLYQLAMLYYELNQDSHMLTALKEIDTLQNEYAPAHNLRAYYYATKGKDLHLAQNYFDKAYIHDRGNPHFLDTQALIFYKQRNYDKALKLLQPIAEKLPNDSSILIHLAKTYHKLGEHDNARNTIDKAQQCAQTIYEKQVSAILAYQWNKK